MTQLRKHAGQGRRARQETALRQRNDELTRYGEGDFTDAQGHSLIPKDLRGKERNKAKKAKKVAAAQDIEALEEKVGFNA